VGGKGGGHLGDYLLLGGALTRGLVREMLRLVQSTLD
jgi:hypothetical protein